MKIEPGDMCVIVGEDHDCEANIGATLTVVELSEDISDRPAWVWKDASRLIACSDEDGIVRMTDNEDRQSTIPGRYLVPIRDPDADGGVYIDEPAPARVRELELEPA
jgi:hypothetical protein